MVTQCESKLMTTSYNKNMVMVLLVTPPPRTCSIPAPLWWRFQGCGGDGGDGVYLRSAFVEATKEAKSSSVKFICSTRRTNTG